MNIHEQQIVIFSGRSGSGKGTQADLLKINLAESGKVVTVGTGIYFRKLIAEDTPTGKLYKDAYDRGELAPDFLVTTLLGNVFANEYTGSEHMIFDGVARLQHEAESLTEMFNFYQIKKVKVVYIDVSSEWALDKVTKRGRVDDRDYSVKIKWFEEKVVPVFDYFKSLPLYDFITVNGEQTVEEVHQEILSKL